jgi:hypothetical protein
MELLGFIFLILVVIGFSSNRSKKPSSGLSSTYIAPQRTVVKPNPPQLTKPPIFEHPNHRSTSTNNIVPSPVSTGSNSSRESSSEDVCNRCGRRWRRWDNTDNGGYWYSCSGWPGCDNTRDKQLREKFCANGHKRTVSNTAYTAAGHRRCLICRPLAEKKSVERQSSRGNATRRNSSETKRNKTADLDKFCRNGHRRTDENTYVRPDGQRECKVCRQNARR